MMTRMLPPLLSVDQIVKIADDLARDGLSISENALPAAQIAAWRARALALQNQGELKAAGIGRAQTQEIVPQVRGDTIAWLDTHSIDTDEQSALNFLDTLKIALNANLYLSLDHVEAHFALYPPGGRYSKHLDRHRDTDARVISLVLYLNETWQSEWGGQLNIFDGEDNLLRSVEPSGGTLVLFRSEQFPHEVVPATKNRLSLTGWFRRRT
jgi:SM-20-related protein